MAPLALAIRKKLNEAKRGVKLREAGTVALALLTFTMVFLSVEIVLDRIFLLDRVFRSAALFAFEAIGAVAAGLGVFFSVRRISDLFAARAIESRAPELNQSLLTYVQMQGGDALGSAAAFRSLEEKLTQDLPRVNFASGVRRRLLSLARYSALIAGLFLGASVLTAGRGFGVCLERALRPGAGIAPPTRTRIVEVTPRDAHALVGQDVEIIARIEGVAPTDAQVLVSYGQDAWFSVPMKAEAGRWQAVLPGSQVSFRYLVAAGDSRSDRYAVTVHPPAGLERLSSVVQLPDYTGAPERRGTGGDIVTLPGSTVALWGASTRPLRSATIVFDDGRRVPFSARTAPWLRAEFVARTTASYRIETVDEYGLANPAPPTLRLEVRPDRPPEVAIVQPGPVVELAPGQSLDIVVEVTDDFGVAEVRLRFRQRGGSQQSQRLSWKPGGGHRQDFRFTPPDSVAYWVEARDRAQPPNVGRSAIHVLHLRRRPQEELARYESLQKALLSDESLRRKLGIEETSRREWDELARKQRELVEAIRRIGKQDDLRGALEQIRQLRREVEKTLSETDDLQTRGLEKQDSEAALLADKLERLRERLNSLLERVSRLPLKQGDFQRALRKIEDASRHLQEAARALSARRDGDSGNAQAAAERDLGSAEQSIRGLIDSELSESEVQDAEALARLEKAIRELTEELRRRSTPEDAERLRRAAQSMRDAQRALEQGSPGAASEPAEEALDRLKQDEPTREADPETAASLERLLREMLEEQQTVAKETREVDARRGDGALRQEDRDRLVVLSKREGVLAGKAEEAARTLENDSAPVFAWSLESVREDLIELRDLLDPKQRTDDAVRSLQDATLARLKELIEALRQEPNGGGSGGGAGGRPPSVSFEAQLKLTRTLQADILRRSEAMRSKCRSDADLSAGDRLILNKLVQQQEELRRMVERMAEGTDP